MMSYKFIFNFYGLLYLVFKLILYFIIDSLSYYLFSCILLLSVCMFGVVMFIELMFLSYVSSFLLVNVIRDVIIRLFGIVY